jgi:hypothetical protein
MVIQVFQVGVEEEISLVQELTPQVQVVQVLLAAAVQQ